MHAHRMHTLTHKRIQIFVRFQSNEKAARKILALVVQLRPSSSERKNEKKNRKKVIPNRLVCVIVCIRNVPINHNSLETKRETFSIRFFSSAVIFIQYFSCSSSFFPHLFLSDSTKRFSISRDLCDFCPKEKFRVKIST